MVRTEYDTSSSKDMALRTSLLFRLAKELKWLSDIFHVCIVVINQVNTIIASLFLSFLIDLCD